MEKMRQGQTVMDQVSSMSQYGQPLNGTQKGFQYIPKISDNTVNKKLKDEIVSNHKHKTQDLSGIKIKISKPLIQVEVEHPRHNSTQLNSKRLLILPDINKSTGFSRNSKVQAQSTLNQRMNQSLNASNKSQFYSQSIDKRHKKDDSQMIILNESSSIQLYPLKRLDSEPRIKGEQKDWSTQMQEKTLIQRDSSKILRPTMLTLFSKSIQNSVERFQYQDNSPSIKSS